MTAKLSGAARHDPRHVIETQRTRLEEGRGSLTCSCSHVIERAISQLYGEDPFEPLRTAFLDHRREAGAGEPRPIRGTAPGTFNPSMS